MLLRSIPNGQLSNDPIPDLAPDLAVEVLRVTNTPGEMKRKRKEYFEAGVKLVWMVDPKTRSVAVFSAQNESVELTESDVLDGGDVLPDFSLALAELFAELDRHATNG